MIDQLAISLCKSLKLCKSGANNDGDTETTIVRSTQHQLKPAIIFIIVKLRQGSGKDGQGMALKAKGFKA